MSSSSPISSEEQEQILQTIEMFEVIVQANPQDTQSMEILKDAYLRVGKVQDMLLISERLAETHVALGQYSSAHLEYEDILLRDPANPEIMAALGDVDEKLQKAGQGRPILPQAGIDLDFGASVGETGPLMMTAQTHGDQRYGGRGSGEVSLGTAEDGNDALGKFLIQHRLVSQEVLSSALERVHKKNKDLGEGMLATSLIDEITRRGGAELDTLLCGIIDRSKFAYIPLEYYDVDRQIVRMLPENITLGRLIVPFDVISRTIMVATANPFDAAAKEAVQQMLDYNIQWHLASPTAIFKVLGETYRINPGAPVGAPPGASAADAPSFRLAT